MEVHQCMSLMKKSFDLHNIKKKDFENYKVTRSIEIECDTIK